MNINDLKIVPVSEIPKAESVQLDDPLKIYALCNKMQTLCEKLQGVGLSAVQVGVPLNVCIVKNHEKYDYFVNCSYIGIGDKIKSIEGCLSILNGEGKPRQFELQRYPYIAVNGYCLHFTKKTPYIDFLEIKNTNYYGFQSIVVQHELDHSVGVLISDLGKEIKVW